MEQSNPPQEPAYDVTPANGTGPPPPFASPFEPPVDAPPEPIRPPDAGPAPDSPPAPAAAGPSIFTTAPPPPPAGDLSSAISDLDQRLGMVQIQTAIAIGLALLVLAAVLVQAKRATTAG